ncbi:MAG: L,D-transpeptidase [Rhodothermia bacterium]|nr:L,D-transpeptidase [Rhodothermia bacterium]
MRAKLFVLSILVSGISWAVAQQSGVFDQRSLAKVYQTKAPSLDVLPEITYSYISANSADAFWQTIGKEYKPLLQMLNRDIMGRISPSDSLIVPDQLGLDHRAYSPFPKYYAGAELLDKFFVVDKSYQLYAAYEFGKLVRWGVVSTGRKGAKAIWTPSGRFNFNWRQDFRISSDSPPGQEWRLNWVSNFYLERGIHTHQYAIPVVGAASHGCVRMIDADAKWVYNWHRGWVMKNKQLLEQGNMVIVQGEDLSRAKKLFVKEKSGPHLKMIALPPDPWTVEAGSPQQKMFDRRRERHQSATEQSR